MKQIVTALVLLASINLNAQQTSILPAPDWAKDLIIYEISTKNYTSPDGHGTGTFNSLKEKIPYIADLGVTGIWLTGHNWADDDHFYNLWTQYATIRPDSIDPSLGTPDDFKALVDEFHKHDIKVFLDLITHGVMKESQLIEEHPEWFKGGSWGMTDYDWHGGHEDLDEWWVKTHVDYVLDYGVDGYRLDVGIYRPDLYHEIKKQCSEAGHPIVVWLESVHHNDHACDFYQRMETISDQRKGVDTLKLIYDNVGKYFNNISNNVNDYLVKIYYHDGTNAEGSAFSGGELMVKTKFEPGIKPGAMPKEMNKEENYTELFIKNINPDKRITYIDVQSNGNHWQLGSPSENWTRMKIGETMHLYLEPLPKEKAILSTQLSSHDDGWDSFPADQDPYVAEGSRCLFGYSCLFTPSIPLFMSGEEFHADYIPNPTHTPRLFGKGKPGTGTWLYAGIIDCKQLEEEKHQQMLNDVKKMISIRKSESDIFSAGTNYEKINIQPVKTVFNGETGPIPYLQWNDKKMILVAGNYGSTASDQTCEIYLKTTGFENHGQFKVTNLMTGKSWVESPQGLKMFTFTVGPDKTPGGGVTVFRIEPVN